MEHTLNYDSTEVDIDFRDDFQVDVTIEIGNLPHNVGSVRLELTRKDLQELLIGLDMQK